MDSQPQFFVILQAYRLVLILSLIIGGSELTISMSYLLVRRGHLRVFIKIPKREIGIFLINLLVIRMEVGILLLLSPEALLFNKQFWIPN
jgi:hypothetical protein